MSHKIKILFSTLGALIILSLPSSAAAVPDPGGGGAPAKKATPSDSCHPEFDTYSDGTLIGNKPLSQSELQSCEACKQGASTCLKENVIVKDLNIIINVLTGLVSVIVIAMLITGGLQYIWAGGNPQAAVNARTRIINALIAAFALLFIWAFLQWIVPGGI